MNFPPPLQILLNNEAYLYHSNKSFRVFLEDVLKGTGWKAQYSGWNGCSGWDRFIRSRVTLIESFRDTRWIHQLSDPVLPDHFPNFSFDITYAWQTSSDHKKPWTSAPWPRGVMRAARAGESTPAISPALNRDRETRATGRGIRWRGPANLSTLLYFYYRQSQASEAFQPPVIQDCREKRFCQF